MRKGLFADMPAGLHQQQQTAVLEQRVHLAEKPCRIRHLMDHPEGEREVGTLLLQPQGVGRAAVQVDPRGETLARGARLHPGEHLGLQVDGDDATVIDILSGAVSAQPHGTGQGITCYEGQSILVKGEALMSGRTGFKSPLPEYAPPIESLKLIKMDWKGLSTDKLKVKRDEWTSIFNP